MKKISFVKAVYNINETPQKKLPSVVLCGRSNVGKSSFINCLFSPSKVAKTSSTPGKTRSINYYLVENKFYIVDLPGYGYAKTSKSERDFWQNLIEKFFLLNKDIAAVLHLIDSRHDPTALDMQLNSYIKERNLPYYIVLNKIDKLKQSEIALAKRNCQNYFPEKNFGVDIFHFSALKGIGKKEIIYLLSSLQL